MFHWILIAFIDQMSPTSFYRTPNIQLLDKKRGVNLYPITHNIENFSRWPTNLNDPLLKTPPRELCPSVSGSGLVELNTREFIGHTHNDIPRLRLPSRTYLVWSYMSCVPLAEHSEGKYNSLSVICITLRPLQLSLHTDRTYSRFNWGLQYCQLIILESSLSVCLILSQEK